MRPFRLLGVLVILLCVSNPSLRGAVLTPAPNRILLAAQRGPAVRYSRANAIEDEPVSHTQRRSTNQTV